MDHSGAPSFDLFFVSLGRLLSKAIGSREPHQGKTDSPGSRSLAIFEEERECK